MKNNRLSFCFLFLAIGVISVVSFVSCSDDEKDPYEGLTRYTVIGKVPSMAAHLISTATVYEYDTNDVRVDSNIIKDPSSGKRYRYKANDLTNHLKVKLVSKENTFRWGDTIILVRPTENVDVVISVSSPTNTKEPKYVHN